MQVDLDRMRIKYPVANVNGTGPLVDLAAKIIRQCEFAIDTRIDRLNEKLVAGASYRPSPHTLTRIAC